MAFYSQHSEDALLAYFFPRAQGTCIEVGANDGVTFSTTKHFEEKGWRCILIEPTPSLCDSIRQVRSGELHQCAASDRNGYTTFRFVAAQPLYSSLEAAPTMKDALCDEAISEIRVKTRRLDDILHESGVQSIDFITIDVEGHELSALSGFSLSRWVPSVLIIEDQTDLDETPVSAMIRRSGYRKFYRSGGNDWYAPRGRVPLYGVVTLTLCGKLKLSGLLKTWLPSTVRRPLILGSRKLRGLLRR